MSAEDVGWACILALCVLLVFSMYVAIMGPTRYHRGGFIGRLYWWIRHSFMNLLGIFCCRIYHCGRRKEAEASWKACLSYVTGRNWILVTVYAVLVGGMELAYLLLCLPKLRVAWYSKVVSWGLVLLAEFLYAMAILVDPGTVSTDKMVQQQLKETAAGLSKNKKKRFWDAFGEHTIAEEYVLNRRYPVDGVLYERQLPRTAVSSKSGSPKSKEGEADPQVDEEAYRNALGQKVGFGVQCSTCLVPRPSRSKHCRLCGRCVRRFDHHCPWINSDVGENTQRYFLGFLMVHAVSCWWGSWDLYALIKQFLVDGNMWGWQFTFQNRIIPLTSIHYLMVIVTYQLLPFFLFLFAVLMGIVLIAFSAYMFSFAVRNITINEMHKMDDVLAYLNTLKTPSALHTQAGFIRQALLQFELHPAAMKRMRSLVHLPPPPPHLAKLTLSDAIKNDKASAGSRSTKKRKSAGSLEEEWIRYRNEVLQTVARSLRALYHRGWVENTLEVLFPYSPRLGVQPHLVDEVQSRVESIVGTGEKEEARVPPPSLDMDEKGGRITFYGKPVFLH